MHAVDVAVLFVAAQAGGCGRILAVHHQREDGYCGGCATVPTRWPCTAASIARTALKSSTRSTGRSNQARGAIE